MLVSELIEHLITVERMYPDEDLEVCCRDYVNQLDQFIPTDAEIIVASGIDKTFFCLCRS